MGYKKVVSECDMSEWLFLAREIPTGDGGKEKIIFLWRYVCC